LTLKLSAWVELAIRSETLEKISVVLPVVGALLMLVGVIVEPPP